ncbi:NAD(P)H-dependent oxidoreductase [Rhodovulum kholense]|uniref:Flavodoxin-like protein n=1 Tax=Rhodovulum kholense TaxID=453584 RepID=A0A8E2VPT7_9RHOB|nr:NAD(P)H-dependent oxidoreductase [Rhodovulum kholense]PTW52237.1 flavodoxin-like protein [Rhodovulum kholense]
MPTSLSGSFPFDCFGLPGLMKTWVDRVPVHGFAHGAEGTRLQGKPLIQSFTTGAPGAAYASGQPMTSPLEDFLPAQLCGMDD